MSDDIREWLKTIPVVTDADKAELREAITKLEAQQRGTRNAETMLCEMLEVDDGSQILDAIQGLKERINRLEEQIAGLRDPETMRANLLRGLVALPSGYGETGPMEERIKRLEEHSSLLTEAGNEVFWSLCPSSPAMMTEREIDALKAWNKAKEAKP